MYFNQFIKINNIKNNSPNTEVNYPKQFNLNFKNELNDANNALETESDNAKKEIYKKLIANLEALQEMKKRDDSINRNFKQKNLNKNPIKEQSYTT